MKQKHPLLIDSSQAAGYGQSRKLPLPALLAQRPRKAQQEGQLGQRDAVQRRHVVT